MLLAKNCNYDYMYNYAGTESYDEAAAQEILDKIVRAGVGLGIYEEWNYKNEIDKIFGINNDMRDLTNKFTSEETGIIDLLTGAFAQNQTNMNNRMSQEEYNNYVEQLLSEAETVTRLDELYYDLGLITKAQYEKRVVQVQKAQKELLKEYEIISDLYEIADKYAKKRQDAQELTSNQIGNAAMTSWERERGFLDKERAVIQTAIREDKTQRRLDIGNLTDFFASIKTPVSWDEIKELAEYDKHGNIINWDIISKKLLEEDKLTHIEGNRLKDLVSQYETTANSLVTSFEKFDQIEMEYIEYMGRRSQIIQTTYEAITQEAGLATDTINNYAKVISTVGAENLGVDTTIQRQIAEQQDMSATMDFANKRSYYQAQKQELERLRQELVANSSTLSFAQKSALEALIREQEKTVNTALTDMNDSWNQALTQAAETFKEKISLTLKDFESSISGVADGLDEIKEIFAQQSETQSWYLEDYEKIYQLNKLSRDLQSSIDETESVQGKQLLNQLQQELTEKQMEGVKVSEYDLEHMRKKYELRLAEIALEESQNAKNQVRLQKMANGSWGYVYTQNEDNIAKAQAEYEEKLFNLQDHNANYLNTISESILNTEQEFMDAVTEIYNSGLSEEEQRERILRLTEFYEEKMNYLTSEMDGVLSNNQGLTGMITEFSDTLLGAMYPEYDSAESIFTKWKEAVGDEDSGLVADLLTVANNYSSSINNIFSVLNTSVTEWSASIGQTATELATTITTAFSKITRELNITTFNKMVTGHDRFSLENLLHASLGIDLSSLQEMSNNDLLKSYAQIIGSKQVEADEQTKDELVSLLGNAGGISKEALVEMLKGTNQLDYLKFGTRFENTELTATNASYSDLWDMIARAGGLSWLDSNFIYKLIEQQLKAEKRSYDTGGYTGEWGPSGRLAVIHEKEYMLNAMDTPNILAAVELVRQISHNIDLQSLVERSKLLQYSATTPHQTNSSALQQEVVIHAEFPNATSHSEIEQAFDTLINRATQYSNRK